MSPASNFITFGKINSGPLNVDLISNMIVSDFTVN